MKNHSFAQVMRRLENVRANGRLTTTKLMLTALRAVRQGMKVEDAEPGRMQAQVRWAKRRLELND